MSNQTKQAAIYARTAVSQESTNFVLASQIEQCKAFCQERGYTVEEGNIYMDEFSGIEEYQKRPGLVKALKVLAKSGAEKKEQKLAFDKFVIRSFDRLSRDPAQAVAIIDELQKHGVMVESVDGHGLDAAAQSIQAIKQGIAQIEREQFTRRMKYGKQAARKRREQEQQQ